MDIVRTQKRLMQLKKERQAIKDKELQKNAQKVKDYWVYNWA